MRRILVDHAKSKHSARRGGGDLALLLDEVAIVGEKVSSQMVDLGDGRRAMHAFPPIRAMDYFQDASDQ